MWMCALGEDLPVDWGSARDRNKSVFINFLCRSPQSNDICLDSYLWSRQAKMKLFVTHSPFPSKQIESTSFPLRGAVQAEQQEERKTFEWENNKKINTQQQQTSIWRNVKTFSITCVFNWDFPFDFVCLPTSLCRSRRSGKIEQKIIRQLSWRKMMSQTASSIS